MGKTFAAVKLCHTDDFPTPQNEGIKRWIENNGGTFQLQITSDTTHLICSKIAWKRNSHPLLKEARRHNKELAKKNVPRSKRIHIVKYDWLEDSLQSKSRKPKNTAPYDWEQKRLGRMPAPASPQPSVTQGTSGPKVAEKAEKMNRKMIEFNKEIEEFETTMQAKGYHPYADSTGFLYLIVLVRRDIEKNLIERHRIKVRYSAPSVFASTGSPSQGTCPVRYVRFPAPYPFAAYPVVEVHQPNSFVFKPFSPNRKLRVPIPNPWAHCLQLFESDDKPRKYACYLAYTAGRPGMKRETQELAPVNSDWEFAWGMFTKIFKLKTGIDWDVRPELSESTDVSRLQSDGETAGVSKKYFEYVPPKAGLPQGLRYSIGCTDEPALETQSFKAEQEAMEDITQSIEGVEGVDSSEKRPGVSLLMPGTVIAPVDDMDTSAITPDGDCW